MQMTNKAKARIMAAHEALRYSCAEPVVKDFLSWAFGYLTTEEAAETVPFVKSLKVDVDIPVMGEQLDMFAGQGDGRR